MRNKKYSPTKIASELIATALGEAYYGNALYVAMDFPVLTADDKSVIRRWLNGKPWNTDHINLQQIALKICDCSNESKK